MPLFRDCSSLDYRAKGLFFDANFCQWTVGRKQITFEDTGEVRNKYFIIVSHNADNAQLYCVLTHTDPTLKLENTHLATHLLYITPEKTDRIFVDNCYVDCTTLHKLERTLLRDEYLKTPHILIGVLPEEICRSIHNIIIGSELIEPEMQELIYSDLYR